MDNKEQTAKDEFPEQARNFLDRGLYQLARNLAETRLAEMPGDVEGRVILCEALWGLGYDDEAQEIIREIEEIIRGYSEIYGIMGKICQQKGLFREAIHYYRRFLDLNPRSSRREEITRQLALLREQEKAFRAASEPATAAVDPEPEQEPPAAATLRQWLDKLEGLQKKRNR